MKRTLRKVKQLKLSKETLRQLNAAEMQNAAGGTFCITNGPSSCAMASENCCYAY